ncbi:MAG: HD domain-containing phosphohydrolase [Vicinamibacterales bacterium]
MPPAVQQQGQSGQLPFKALVFVALVLCAGVAVLAKASTGLLTAPPPAEWIFFAALSFLSGAFNIKVPAIPARISVSEAFVFATVLLYGPEAATIVVTLDAVMMSVRLRSSRKYLFRTPFNVAAAASSIWVSGQVYVLLLGPGNPASGLPLNQFLVPLLALAICYFLLNSGLVAIAMSLERRGNPLLIWRSNFLWLGLNYLGGASFAALIVSYRQQFDFTMLGVIVPLLVITYLTFRTSLGRLEDANRHVSQLNELYVSTIETLAMAVDAKDQITHGHIRRVQVYATELARRLGVKEESQIRAIEAAALLHDMGKLAIPENILNKPGKLSDAEYDKMKQHASIGADLLSAIRFPYPVVPIVRHHHEFWNGKGYPSGIAGTDIPLGARILSVVDCFDALNSDRPYRPKLSPEEAFSVLRERRGVMYDPLVVDTFIGAYDEIAPIAIAAGEQARSLITPGTFADEGRIDSTLDKIREGAATTSQVFEATKALGTATSQSAAFGIAARHVRQTTPAAVCALFLHDSSTDVVRCVEATGDKSETLFGLEINMGERISGWAASHRQPISNSDPALDLGPLVDSFRSRPRSALVVPLICGNSVVGVLSSYAFDENAFRNEHRYAVEQLCGILAAKLAEINGPESGNLLKFSPRKA